MARKSALAFFALTIGTSLSATPVDDPEQMAARAALETAMKSATEELFAPGPIQADWDRGGVDIRKVVQAAPGGSAKNYLLTIDNEGSRTVTILDASRDLQLPASWSVVSRVGTERPASADLVLASLDGPYFVVGWEGERRVGDAYCSSANLGGELHRSADIRADSEIPYYLLPVIFNAAVKRFQENTICWRFDRENSGYRVSYFLEDGSTLPGMNKSAEVVTLVPAGPIEDLLATPPNQD